jgi:hypothetical protein
VRICLDEESSVLKTVLRVLYLGEASSRANSNPAAGQLMAILGKENSYLIFAVLLLSLRTFFAKRGKGEPT